MAVPLLGLHRKSQYNKSSLLMERAENHNDSGHVIDITSSGEASSSSSLQDRPFNGSNPRQNEDQPSTSVRAPVFQPSFSSTANGSNSRNSSFIRRGNGPGRRRSPLNSGLWISIELVLTVSQIIAAVVGLSLSRHEHPRAPLFAWIIGYASGCVATLPLLYWRYRHRNPASEQDSAQPRQGSPEGNISAPSNVYSSSITRTLEVESHRPVGTSSIGDQRAGVLRARLKALVEYFKMGLDCFFAVWFVVGNVWIFGGHSSANDAPNLYRLCLVFLTFSCIGYAMPFILCATICCCLPCIISVMGFREDLTQNRGATPESINSLPIYKFKIKKTKSSSGDRENNSGAGEGGVVAAGTEKERAIAGEDAVHALNCGCIRVGVMFPTVEVRYKNLLVEAECEVVHGKPLPTLCNYFKRMLSAVPKPVLTLLDLSFPLASSDLGAENLENKFIFSNMHLCQIQRRIEEMAAAGEDTTSLDDEAFNMETALDRCILRLIASCCNCDKLVRATELVKLLSLEKSVRGTIKLVTALKLPNLAERFNTILEDRFIIFILQLYTAMDAQRGHICCCFMLFVEGDKLRRSLRLKMCFFSVACLDHFVINPRLGSII